MKTLPIEDLYADPHKIDVYLDSGESVAVVRDGREVAKLVPLPSATASGGPATRPKVDYRARFLGMWGPNAFRSPVSVSDEFAELRRERSL